MAPLLHRAAIKKKERTRMWANAQRDSRPSEYRSRPLLNAAVNWLTTATRVPCSNAANMGKRKTCTQRECCTWQNSVTGQEPPKMYETARHCAKFGWLQLSDVAAVTKPRRNSLRCPKQPNRSQMLVGRISPYCEYMWEDIAV